MMGGIAVKSRQVLIFLLVLVSVVGMASAVQAANPGAVAIADGLEFGISVEAKTATNSFSYRHLGLLNKHWTDEQRMSVADSLAESGIILTAAADANVFVQYDNYRLSGGVMGEAEVTIPEKLGGLAFRGITLEQIEGGELNFDFSEIQGQGGAYAAGGLTAVFSVADFFELPLKDIQVGIAGRYLYGLAYGETDFNGTLEYIEEDGSARIISKDLDLTALYSRKGQGWAFDAGVFAQVNPKLAVDLSVENIGQMVWTDVSGRRYSRLGEWEVARFGFDTDTFEFDFDFADGEEIEEEELADQEDIIWKLPLKVRLGVEYEFDRQVTLRGNVRQTRYHSGTTDFGVGGEVEYRPVAFVPITVGADYSTHQQFAMDAGVGLRFDNFNLNLNAQNLQSLFLSSGKGMGVAFSMGLQF